MKERDRKIWLAYSKFAYKNTKDDYKLDDRLIRQKDHFQLHSIHGFADKKTAYNEVRLYCQLLGTNDLKLWFDQQALIWINKFLRQNCLVLSINLILYLKIMIEKLKSILRILNGFLLNVTFHVLSQSKQTKRKKVKHTNQSN